MLNKQMLLNTSKDQMGWQVFVGSRVLSFNERTVGYIPGNEQGSIRKLTDDTPSLTTIYTYIQEAESGDSYSNYCAPEDMRTKCRIIRSDTLDTWILRGKQLTPVDQPIFTMQDAWTTITLYCELIL